MKLTILNVAFPLAPVRSDTAGGAEQAVLLLDHALVRAGHRSIVAACSGSKPAGVLVETPVPCGMIDDDVRNIVTRAHAETINRALVEWKVDIIHMHGIDFGDYLPPDGVPVLVTLHLPHSWYDPPALLTPRPGTWFNCVSRSQQAACPDLPNLFPYIENGVEVDAFNARSGRRDYALALGRICYEKGYHIALEAAKKAGIPLRIAGQVFPYEEHIRYFEKEIHPRLDGRRYRFLGPVGFVRKRHLLASARCLLIPSLVPETSSLVAMEALASGTPVIAFPAGALADIVQDGETGFLVRDADEMAAAIEKAAFIDPEICRASARERFSAKRMAERYFDLYVRIIDKPKIPDRKDTGARKTMVREMKSAGQA
jgi:glycosyltransferase involved in cell wall biosynthesis